MLTASPNICDLAVDEGNFEVFIYVDLFFADPEIRSSQQGTSYRHGAQEAQEIFRPRFLGPPGGLGIPPAAHSADTLLSGTEHGFEHGSTDAAFLQQDKSVC